MQTVGLPAPAGEWPRFDTPNILWFFGAFIAAAACFGVISQTHGSARGSWILLVSLAFLGAFALLSAALLRAGRWVPGGVFAATAVTFVPVVGYGFERLIGVWRQGSPIGPFQEYEGRIFALVLALVVAGLFAFALVRFHFILAIVAWGSFVASQLLLPVVVRQPSFRDHATSFVVVGAGLIVVGLALDLLPARRAAFWWHLVGLVALSIGLAYHAFRHATWGWVLIFVAGTLILLLASVLRRATWGLFGIAGFFAPIAHYLNVWLGNLGTALALAAVGLGIVGLGMAARRYGASLTQGRFARADT